MSNATHAAPFPRLPLMAAIACVLASLFVVAGARLAGLSPSQHLEGAEVIDTRLLRFADASNGSVEVFDGATGKLITTAAPGTNGFLRGSLRGLMRVRKREAVSYDMPFRLDLMNNGQLLLTDLGEGTTLDLNAYGRTNAAVFEALLPRKGVTR